MRKLLTLTVLSLAIFLGNIGTNSAQALTVTQALTLKHNMIVSLHTVNWYEGKGHWTLHKRFNTCDDVALRYSQKRAAICYHARLDLKAHTERYERLKRILFPPLDYSDGGYNWDSMVNNCEARGAGWYANTGNGFYFGPQFTPLTWHSSGGGPVLEMDGRGPSMKSYSVSYIKHIAYNTMKLQGPGAWPNCNGFLF